MYTMAQQQSKAHNEALYKPTSRTIPSMPSAGLPNSVLLSLLENTDDATSQPNKTGLPDALKERFERLTGLPLDDVRVHRNSDKPAELGALAYAQGNEIHLGPGQEKYLEHELGHVVQQKQGLVEPTGKIEDIPVNENEKLEADVDLTRGAPPISGVNENRSIQLPIDNEVNPTPILQMKKYMRALQAENKVDGELQALKYKLSNGEERSHPAAQNSINGLMDGFYGMPTTPYIDGKAKYFAPVGYSLEIGESELDNKVIAEKEFDVGSNDLCYTLPTAVTLVDEIMKKMSEQTGWTTFSVKQYSKDILLYGDDEKISESESQEAFGDNFSGIIDAIKKAYPDIKNRMKLFVIDYIKEKENPNDIASQVQSVIDQHLRQHYAEQFSKAVSGSTMYPESVLHAQEADIHSVWYVGENVSDERKKDYYDNRTNQPEWEMKNTENEYVANRKNSAEKIKDKIETSTSKKNIEVENIKGS